MMSQYQQRHPHNYNTTYALAQFLATTGPEEYQKKHLQHPHVFSSHDTAYAHPLHPHQQQQQQQQGPRFFDWLRRRHGSVPNAHTTAHSQQASTSVSAAPRPLKQHASMSTTTRIKSSARAESPATTVTTIGSNATTVTSHKKHIPLLGEDYRPFGDEGGIELTPDDTLDLSRKRRQSCTNTCMSLGHMLDTPHPTMHHHHHHHHHRVVSDHNNNNGVDIDDDDDQDDDDNDNDHDHLHDDDDDDDDEDDLPGAFPMPPSSHESLRKKASTTMIINKTATSATIAKTLTVAPSPCHMATQTTFEDNDLWNSIGDARRVSVVGSNGRCRLCSRVATHEKDEKHTRRRSCPPALASGARIKLGQEATVLLALIEQLKQQLAEEQQSRKILEQTIQQQLSSATLLSPSSSSHTRTSTS